MIKSFLILAVTSFIALADDSLLSSWEVRKGEEKFWREEGGVIIGGSLKERIPTNTFIASKFRSGNFEMTFKVKLVGDKKANAGVMLYAERIPDHHEMIGFQADIGQNYWGKVYDECRRHRVVGAWIDPKTAKAAIKGEGWNDYRIRAEGPRIQIWLNGVKTADYTEKDANVALEGHIALQAHSGVPFEVHYKDIAIKKLPAVEGVKTWADLGKGAIKIHRRKK